MFSDTNITYAAFEGRLSLIFIKLQVIYSIKYKLHTRFILTDMKSIKQNGIIKVKSIEFFVFSPKFNKVYASLSSLAIDGKE